MTRVAPSVALEMEISELLEQGITDSEDIARLGRLGAQLVLQKGIEDEVAAFLQRVRYERTVEARGSRNGNRPKRVLTAEGELEIQMPQLRNTAVKFVSRVGHRAEKRLRFYSRCGTRTRPVAELKVDTDGPR